MYDLVILMFFFFFFKQKTANEVEDGLGGSEMGKRDRGGLSDSGENGVRKNRDDFE